VTRPKPACPAASSASPGARPRWWRTTLVISAASLALTVVALASAQVALPQALSPHVAALLTAAAVVAVVAGAGLGWSLVRAVTALESTPDAAAALAARLPQAVTRTVWLSGAAVATLALAEAVRHPGPAVAVWTVAIAAAAFVATAALAATLLTRAALRRRGRAAQARQRARRMPRRLAGELALLAVGAAGPAAALGLGSGAPPGIVVALLALVLVAAAMIGRAVGTDAALAVGQSAAALYALSPQLEAPSAAGGGRGLRDPVTAEARAVALATTQVGDRLAKLRRTRGHTLERALEAERLRTQFLANTSHELRSPLHAVLGYTDLLLRGVDGPLADAQRHSLDHIQRSGAQLLFIIQEVLDLARIDAGKLDLVRSLAIPGELVEQAVEEMRRRFPAITIDVATRLERGLPTISADAYRMVQALTYLLIYAVEATTAGGRRKRARIIVGARQSQRGPERRCDFTVAAPDANLAAHEHERLFDGFRLVTGRTGLGLGPHLAKRFVELHDGDVHTGPPGPGVRFDVSLPAPPQAPSPAAPSPAAPGVGAVVKSDG
jgi:signal transduction histidine kinase